MIDTHAHIGHPRLKDIRAEILRNLNGAPQPADSPNGAPDADGKLDAIIEVAYDKASAESALSLVGENSGVYAAIGAHPHYAADLTTADFDFFDRGASHKKVVAFGEVGLDYYRNLSPKPAQTNAFVTQLGIAASHKLPVVIHSRDAEEDIVKLLNANKNKLLNGVLFHCYAGGAYLAKHLIDRYNAYFSFGGVITFKNNARAEVIGCIPQERILAETDCPYLSPEPHRGEVNRPENVRFVIQKLAQIWDVSFAEADKITTQNAKKYFHI